MPVTPPPGPVSITAAVVQPTANESVTLKNNGNRPINLDGWFLMNKNGVRAFLTGTLQQGSVEISVAKTLMRLSNTSDTISLHRSNDRNVTSRSYTAQNGQVSWQN